MEKEFVSYEQAVALKELGFDEKCFAAMDMYSNIDYGSEMYNWVKNSETIQATWAALPLKQQVFRWFRQKYGVYPTIMTETADDSLYFRFIAEGGPEWLSFSKIYYTYEEAENACIDKLIQIVKENNL